MQIKISDGSVVEIDVGMLVERTDETKATPEEGMLEVLGFDSGYPVVMIGDTKAAISGDTIKLVTAKPEAQETVDLGGGNLVTVSAKAAEIIKDMLVTMAALMEEIKDLRSGGAVAELQAQIDLLKKENEKLNTLVGDKDILRERILSAQALITDLVQLME